MRGKPWLVMGVSLLACSSGDPVLDETAGRSHSPIVNGELALDDPAVVALTVQGQVFCSATLITPSIVLSAAHCLPPHGPVPVAEIEVLFGTGPVVDELIVAHAAWAHPDWSEQAYGDDIGLLQMKAVADATPIALRTTQVPNDTDVRMIGFGITGTNESDAGTKRTGVGRIDSQDAFVMDIDKNPAVTCSGDSGGPTMAMTNGEETVAGIHSLSDCFFGNIDTRVDAYLTEIQAFIDSHPDPSCAADGLCAAPCEGAVDPDCPCAADGECTSACPDPDEDPDCVNACGPDGVCEANCGVVDPDCPSCGPDGHCVVGCPADPDCSDTCDPSTECCDAACEEPDDPFAVDQGGCGCRVVGTPRTPTSASWALLLLGLTAARRRRRPRCRLRDRRALR